MQAPALDAKLAARVYQIDLHCSFACASSRPAWWRRKLYRARKPQRLSLAVRKFRACEQGYSISICWEGNEKYSKMETGCHYPCSLILCMCVADQVTKSCRNKYCALIRIIPTPTFQFQCPLWWHYKFMDTSYKNGSMESVMIVMWLPACPPSHSLRLGYFCSLYPQFLSLECQLIVTIM